MSIGSAAVGIAFSPINPFSVGIAQKVAQLPLLSGLELPRRGAHRGTRDLDVVDDAACEAHADDA